MTRCERTLVMMSQGVMAGSSNNHCVYYIQVYCSTYWKNTFQHMATKRRLDEFGTSGVHRKNVTLEENFIISNAIQSHR